MEEDTMTNPLSIVPIMQAMIEDTYTKDKMVTWAVALAQEQSSKTNQEAAAQAIATLTTVWGQIIAPTVIARLGKRPKKAKTEEKRSLQSWNKTPERRLMKCVVGHLIRDGKGREQLLLEFKRLIPDYQSFFDPPGVSDSATWGRADTGRRGGKYAAEAPDVCSVTQPYWAAARKIVDDGLVLQAADVRRIAAEVDLPRDVDLTRDDEMAAEDNETTTEG
jgi:hypothetical protein